MKVKVLRDAIANLPDDLDVVISDVNGACLEVISVSVAAPLVYIDTRQEFPDAWFDPKTNQEYRWINGSPVVLDPKSIKYEFCMDFKHYEKDVQLQLYDGYGEGQGIKVKYPKLEDLTDEQIEAMDEQLGGRISDSGYVSLDDVCCCFAEVDEDTAPPEKGTKHFKNFSVVRTRADEDRTPFDATEVYVYRDDKQTHDVLCELLEEMGFDYMDDDKGTEFNGHLCSCLGRDETKE